MQPSFTEFHRYDELTEILRTFTREHPGLFSLESAGLSHEGRDIWNEGPAILSNAARSCAPLKAALDVWGEVTFNYASTDTPDFVPTPTAA